MVLKLVIFVRVGDVYDDPPHWEGVEQITPQVGPHSDGEATSAREERRVGIPSDGGHNGKGGTSGGGDLHLLPPEYGCTFYYDQAHYGTVSSGGEETGDMGVQSVVITGRVGCGGDVDGSLGGGTDRGGGGYGRDEGGDRLSRWDDNVANVTLRTEPNDPLEYTTGLEHHHPIMSTLGEPRSRL